MLSAALSAIRFEVERAECDGSKHLVFVQFCVSKCNMENNLRFS